MASEKKRGSWMGHPLLDSEHEHDLHLTAALHEFQGGMPRADAEKRALEDYRREHHARAAAHHYAGMRAGHATGNMDDAKKHHALYSLHVKALGEDPMGPVPDAVRKFHGSAGTDKNQRHVYNFRGHDADEFLVRPVTKAELEVVDLKKADPTAGERVEALRVAVNKAIAGISLGPIESELVDYLKGSLGVTLPSSIDSPKEMEKAEQYQKETCPNCGSKDTAGVVGSGEHRICRGQCGNYYKPGPRRHATVDGGGESSTPREGHLKLVKATENLKKTLEILTLAKSIIAQVEKK